MRKLVIEKGAVRANMAVVRKRAQGAALYGVLTGDGGGAGLTAMARILRDEGVGRFAVGSVEEAQQLREAGFVGRGDPHAPGHGWTGRSWSNWWT